MKLLDEKLENAVAIKNILFATDFSKMSEAAFPYVTVLSLRYGEYGPTWPIFFLTRLVSAEPG